jgi:hypothetical protein
LVYFGIFFPVLIFCTTKNLATLQPTCRNFWQKNGFGYFFQKRVWSPCPGPSPFPKWTRGIRTSARFGSRPSDRPIIRCSPAWRTPAIRTPSGWTNHDKIEKTTLEDKVVCEQSNTKYENKYTCVLNTHVYVLVWKNQKNNIEKWFFLTFVFLNFHFYGILSAHTYLPLNSLIYILLNQKLKIELKRFKFWTFSFKANPLKLTACARWAWNQRAW